MRQGHPWNSVTFLLSLAACTPVGYGAGSPPKQPLGASSSATLPRVVGVNLAGLDFGAFNNGTYFPFAHQPPLSQIPHFVKQGVRAFRLPVAWNFLQSQLDTDFNQTNLKIYKEVVDAVLNSGSYAIIECHSYARFNGQIVGQSGVSSESMASFWVQMAKSFPDAERVLLGVANEPWGLRLDKWRDTVQVVVNALDKAGSKHTVLIPGDDFTSLKNFPKWYPTMKSITRTGGSTEGLIFEAHTYFDDDGSGRKAECLSNHVDYLDAALKLLRADGRRLLIAEAGGGSTRSCMQILPQFFEAVKNAYPTVLGALMWSAGAFVANSTHLVTTVADPSSPDGWKDEPNWKSIQKFIPSPVR